MFDDKGTFTEWFGDSLGKGTDMSKQEDEWLETEKRVVVIHRLHQILEPFMLRRQVEDVESKLPPKVRPLTRACEEAGIPANWTLDILWPAKMRCMVSSACGGSAAGSSSVSASLVVRCFGLRLRRHVSR